MPGDGLYRLDESAALEGLLFEAGENVVLGVGPVDQVRIGKAADHDGGNVSLVDGIQQAVAVLVMVGFQGTC